MTGVDTQGLIHVVNDTEAGLPLCAQEDDPYELIGSGLDPDDAGGVLEIDVGLNNEDEDDERVITCLRCAAERF